MPISTHHLHVGRHRGGAGELSVRVHAAHRVRHAVGRGARAHVVGVEGSSSAAARGHREVLLPLVDALLSVGTRDWVLEARGVRGVAGDRDVHALAGHDGHSLADVVDPVAADGRAVALGEGDLAHDPQLARRVVETGIHVGEAVDPRYDEGRVLPETVEDDSQGGLAGAVGALGYADRPFGGGEGFVPREEAEALRFVGEEHGREIAVPEAHLALVGHGAGDAEGLETLAQGLRDRHRLRFALLHGQRGADRIGPAGVVEADRLDAADDGRDVQALLLAQGSWHPRASRFRIFVPLVSRTK